MNKLNKALYEIQDVEDLANRDYFINKINPLIKFILTVIYISLVVSMDKYNLGGVVGMSIYPIFLLITCDISLKDSLKKLKIVLSFVLLMGIFNPLYDNEILISINGINISGGIISMITLILKGILTILSSYLLIATTTIEKICYAMDKIHIPKIFITEVLFIYRYVTVLLKEANKITESYSLRAPNQKGINYKVWGSLIGQLLLRSIDKAENIYESMCLRGYSDKFYYSYKIRYNAKDYIYFIVWIVILGTMRFFPILQIVGNIFV